MSMDSKAILTAEEELEVLNDTVKERYPLDAPVVMDSLRKLHVIFGKTEYLLPKVEATFEALNSISNAFTENKRYALYEKRSVPLFKADATAICRKYLIATNNAEIITLDLTAYRYKRQKDCILDEFQKYGYEAVDKESPIVVLKKQKKEEDTVAM